LGGGSDNLFGYSMYSSFYILLLLKHHSVNSLCVLFAVGCVYLFGVDCAHYLCRYIWSGLIVVLGIYLNLYSKNKASWDASIHTLLVRLGLRRQHWKMGGENIV
jgi:hypothetical protein